jgi:hypothetical protein
MDFTIYIPKASNESHDPLLTHLPLPVLIFTQNLRDTNSRTCFDIKHIRCVSVFYYAISNYRAVQDDPVYLASAVSDTLQEVTMDVKSTLSFGSLAHYITSP